MTQGDQSSTRALVYHLAGRKYGRGVCGTYGMMADSLAAVTCDKCKRSTKFKAVRESIEHG